MPQPLPFDYRLQDGLYYNKEDNSGPYVLDSAGNFLLMGAAGTASGSPMDVNIVGADGGVTINVDEADLAALGATTDTPATTDAADASLIALIKRLLGKTAVEFYSIVTITSVTTNVNGTSFTAFGSQPCTSIDVVNTSGTTIEYIRNGAGVSFSIFDGSSRLIQGITNADQISLRRVDQSATPVTIKAETFQV